MTFQNVFTLCSRSLFAQTYTSSLMILLTSNTAETLLFQLSSLEKVCMRKDLENHEKHKMLKIIWNI